MNKEEILDKIREINEEQSLVESKLKQSKKQYNDEKILARAKVREIKESINDKKVSIFKSLVVGGISISFGALTVVAMILSGFKLGTGFASYLELALFAGLSLSSAVCFAVTAHETKAKNKLERDQIFAEDKLDLVINSDLKLEAEKYDKQFNELSQKKAKFLKALDVVIKEEREEKEKSLKQNKTQKVKKVVKSEKDEKTL